MQPILKWQSISAVYRVMRNCNTVQKNIFQSKRIRIISSFLYKSFHSTHQIREDEHVASALRTKKPKSDRNTLQHFVDMKQVKRFLVID